MKPGDIVKRRVRPDPQWDCGIVIEEACRKPNGKYRQLYRTRVMWPGGSVHWVPERWLEKINESR